MACTTGSVLNQQLICPALEAVDYTVIIQAIAIITAGFVSLAILVVAGQLLIEILTSAGSWLGSLYEASAQDSFIRKQSREIAMTRLSQDISDGVFDEIDYSDPFWSDAGILVFASPSGNSGSGSSQPASFVSHDTDDYSDKFMRDFGFASEIPSLASETSGTFYWSSDAIDSSELEMLSYDGWRG